MEASETTERTIDVIVAFGRLERKAAIEETERKQLEDRLLRLTRGMALAMREAQADETDAQEIYTVLRSSLIEAFGTGLVEQLEATLTKKDYA